MFEVIDVAFDEWSDESHGYANWAAYQGTDYLAGKLIQVSPSGESRVVRTFKPGLADHTFLYAQGDILIAPHMNENTVAAYDISADMK